MSGATVVGSRLRRRPGERGFTIIELLIITVIIGVLAAIAIPQYNGYINKAKITLAIGALDTLRTTLEGFHVDYQGYPTPPIDFANTGLDGDGRRVLPTLLVSQLKKDIFSVDSYVVVGESWTIVAKANDDQHTVLTVNPTSIQR
jgi:prepilin-type N-terminal cleavage/methylation domain-containing protein